MAKKNLKGQLKRAEKILKSGKLLDAKAAYLELSQLNPNDDQIWNTLGQISIKLNHLEDAAAALGKTISLNANLKSAYLDLADTQAKLGRYYEAEQNYHAFLMMQPDSAEGYQAWAGLLAQWGRFNESIALCHKAISLTPENPSPYLKLGDLQKKIGEFNKAESAYKEALTLQPYNANIYFALGNLYRDHNQLDHAEEYYRKGLSLDPSAQAIYEYYIALLNEHRGNFNEANTHYHKALNLMPDSAEIHLSHGLNLLRLGNYKEGWHEHEWRLKQTDWLQQRSHRAIRLPVWNGQKLNDKNILVNAEQGYGDTLQFCRYLPRLARQCKKVTVLCKPELEQLLKEASDCYDVTSNLEQSFDRLADLCIHMMSLPYILDIDINTDKTEFPYLKVTADKFSHWQTIITSKKFKVGLVWSGSPSHGSNQLRSVSLSNFAPLADVPNVHFFSLQKGPGAEQAAIPPEGMRLTDLNSLISDFSDSAAVISQLDLVISVDTAVAHLAGALGKPVWTLLYFPSDWRWLLKRPDTPWYPSMRLFRQEQSRNWPDVMTKVVSALRKEIES